jgi:hypothetical protein
MPMITREEQLRRQVPYTDEEKQRRRAKAYDDLVGTSLGAAKTGLGGLMDILGAQGDISTVLMPQDIRQNMVSSVDLPGGSEWWRQQLIDAGVFNPRDPSTAETVGSLLGGGVSQGAMRGGRAAVKGILNMSDEALANAGRIAGRMIPLPQAPLALGAAPKGKAPKPPKLPGDYGTNLAADTQFRKAVTDLTEYAKDEAGLPPPNFGKGATPPKSVVATLDAHLKANPVSGEHKTVINNLWSDVKKSAKDFSNAYGKSAYEGETSITGLLNPPTPKGTLGFDPAEMATRYPHTGQPRIVYDKQKEKHYWEKVLTPEEKAVQKVRKAAQAEIESGNYTPYFDVTQRFDVDPTKYPVTGNTLTDAVAKTQVTRDQWRQAYDTPEIRARLGEAFDLGEPHPLAHNFYSVGQLEQKFRDVLGPELGQQMFRERMPNAMAATTGGAAPTPNLLMSAYGNFQRNAGEAIPSTAYNMPHPIGGRYASGNMGQYDKQFNQGVGLTSEDQPKRFNFASNFMGHKDRATIDEQMMTLIDPSGKLKAPKKGTYGIIEDIVGDVAAGKGVDPMNYQDVAWAGAKGTTGKPMMQDINEMLWRTHRVTGKPLEEVLNGYINANMPMYGLLGTGVGLPAYLWQTPEEEQ